MLDKKTILKELRDQGVVEHIPFNKFYKIISLHSEYYHLAKHLHAKGMAQVILEARCLLKEWKLTAKDVDKQFKNLYDKLGSENLSLDKDAFLTCLRWEN